MEIKVVRKVLSVNERMAQQNRRFFTEKRVYVVNIMSSPGSGKTALLEKTLSEISTEIPSAVIVGDICTTNDADRLARSGVPVSQINTDAFGGECHLAAHVVENAARELDLSGIRLLFVENVGNLVCPAEFDIGEDSRVVVMSVTEGEDKPLKYPVMFRTCHATLINKSDLLPHLDYDLPQAQANVLNIHPEMPIFTVSAKTGAGIPAWIDWLKARVKKKGIGCRGPSA
jgi:hydrogenase nickel incorporation protein HypB